MSCPLRPVLLQTFHLRNGNTTHAESLEFDIKGGRLSGKIEQRKAKNRIILWPYSCTASSQFISIQHPRQLVSFDILPSLSISDSLIVEQSDSPPEVGFNYSTFLEPSLTASVLLTNCFCQKINFVIPFTHHPRQHASKHVQTRSSSLVSALFAARLLSVISSVSAGDLATKQRRLCL